MQPRGPEHDGDAPRADLLDRAHAVGDGDRRVRRSLVVTGDPGLLRAVHAVAGAHVLALAPVGSVDLLRSHLPDVPVVPAPASPELCRNNAEVLVLDADVIGTPVTAGHFRHAHSVVVVADSPAAADRVTTLSVRRGRLRALEDGLLRTGPHRSRHLRLAQVARTAPRRSLHWVSPALGLDGLRWALTAARVPHRLLEPDAVTGTADLLVPEADVAQVLQVLGHRPGIVPLRLSTWAARS